jgi:pyridoxal phosphate enzyme (YggS family)
MGYEGVGQNLAKIKQRIKEACLKSNRNAEDITLIAVSKTFPAEAALEAYNNGQRDFGENKVQEMVNKFESLAGKDIRWHLIGHLQTNKVKYVAKFVHLIHSVDSVKLAEKINSEAKKAGKIINCLVQVNTSKEEQKSGCEVEEAAGIVKEISEMENVRVKGLMTIGKMIFDENNPDEVNEVRKNFRILRKLRDEIQSQNIPNTEMEYLSMGMTSDFEIAIEEGSNMLRIGSAIFGSRNYNL